MVINSSLVLANVMHKRLRPRAHAFTYGVYYLCFALSQMQSLRKTFISIERWNLLSFYKKDHGPRDGSDLKTWAKDILLSYGVTEANGEIILLTLPRILGYVFNPVSFWFCLDTNGALRAVLSEVSNTFGEHHSYISFHDDHRPIMSDDWLRATKLFHVSPFMDIKGYYLFRFLCKPSHITAQVNYFDDEGLMLATSVGGSAVPLTSKQIIKYFFRYPLVTFKVIALIHFEAVRLVLKGIRYRPKPPPPVQEVTQ